MYDVEEATRIFWRYSKIWHSGESLKQTVGDVFDYLNYVRCNMIKPRHKLNESFEALIHDMIINGPDLEEPDVQETND